MSLGEEIISILTPKLTTLFSVGGAVVDMDERTRAVADKQMQKMIYKRTPSVLKESQGEVECKFSYFARELGYDARPCSFTGGCTVRGC